MTATLIQLIERVLASSLLTPELVRIPARGATDLELVGIPAASCSQLPAFLKRWNGMDLDVIRIHAVGDSPDGLPVVAASPHGLVIASDPSGFTYVVSADGAISSLDHDGNSVTRVADDFDDFIRNYIFGVRAAAFCGDEWAAEVASSLA